MEFPPQLQAPQAWPKSSRLKLTFGLALLLFTCVSCGEQAKPTKGRYLGGPGELTIVINDNHWKGEVGDVIRKYIDQNQPMLPQGEPLLDPVVISKTIFSDLLKRHRNILIVDIEDNARNVETRSEMVESKWAKDQIVYTVHALTEEGFIEEFDNIGATIVEDVILRDRERLTAYQKGIADQGLITELQTNMGLSVTIPKDFQKVKSSARFSSYLRERILYLSGVGHDVIQGLVVYDYPYEGDHQFTPEYQVALRDSIIGHHVLSSNNSPMVVETLLPAEGTQIAVKNNFAYEMRGLWKFNSPIMGGPYVSLSMVDEDKGRVINVDGYAFAPKFDKREFIREMEAIIYSLNY